MSRARAAERHERAAARPSVALVQRKGRFWTASPLFERGRRLTLDGRSRGDAAPGDMVLLGWGKRGARVARVIGRPDVARDVLEGLMLERGLWRVFPRGVEVEARAAAADPPWQGSRRDLTGLPTFTIDPVTARDYDDAVSARRERGAIRVWIHIADVSAYVRPGGALEDETYRRATSVYVPGAVEPMLPPALSNEACSLVPGEERSAVTVEMELAGHEVRSASFHRSVIRSDARLTYAQVDRIYAGSERAEEPWAGPLGLAREVARALAERRAERASVEVESSEPVFEWDGGGHVVGVRAEEQTESHRTIEHLMILANEVVAGYLADRRLPTLYRVHERPDPLAIARLVDQLESLEIPTPPIPTHMSPQEAGELAGEISRTVAQYVRASGRGKEAFGSLVLRSLKQAAYSPRNLGHAGLASARYCHFTSPIRRYPDLVAHRSLLAGLGLDEVAPRATELDDAALHSSLNEREAMQIERDADDVCLAFLLERRLYEHGEGLEFEGEVVGVIGAGAFVRFGEERFEGFLPVRRLRSDWWDLNEEGTALVGAESGRELRIGDPIGVAVARVTPARGRVDLVPA